MRTDSGAFTVTLAQNTKSVALAIPGYMNLNSDEFHIFHDQVLGHGASATIVRAVGTKELESRLGFVQLAAKVFKRGSFEEVDIKYELALMSALQKRSKHILQLAGYTEMPGNLIILSRFYENGTLGSKIHDAAYVYPDGFVSRVVLGMVEGMRIIHSFGIIHFDFKPSNVLLNEHLEPVISDFGVAKPLGSPAVRGLQNASISGFTPTYAAPELYSQSGGNRIILEIDKKVDVFAFAISLWELLERKRPWSTTTGDYISTEAIRHKVLMGERPVFSQHVEQSYPKLWNGCVLAWSQNPVMRPSFDDLYRLFSS